MPVRKWLLFGLLVVFLSSSTASAHVLNDTISVPSKHKKHKRTQYERVFNRKTKIKGRVETSTFHGYIPPWFEGELLRYRNVILDKSAMIAYYRACKKVGHYIGGTGYRSHSAQIGAAAQKPGLAAPAGYSYHELGLAIDIFGVSRREYRALVSVGFNRVRPYDEPWHYSYRVTG